MRNKKNEWRYNANETLRSEFLGVQGLENAKDNPKEERLQQLRLVLREAAFAVEENDRNQCEGTRDSQQMHKDGNTHETR